MDLRLGDTRLLIEACLAQELLRNQCAYVLATAYHESAHTMKPVREFGGERYLKSKPYYPFVGMGYVQLTWKANYEKAGRELGFDYVKNPRLLLKAEHAAPILVLGMKEGWFTGKCLADYVTLHRSDFTGARKIVNGSDRAKLIADIAIRYDGLLKLAGYGSPVPVQPVPDIPPAVEPAKPVTPPVAVPEPPKHWFTAILEAVKAWLGGKK